MGHQAMLNLLRISLCAVLVAQPAMCLDGESCSAAHAVPEAHHNCCCGDACPDLTADATSSVSCDCSDDEQAQPAQPSKPTTNEKRVNDLATWLPVFIQTVHLPASAPAVKAQVRQAHPIHCSTNAFLCVWLT